MTLITKDVKKLDCISNILFARKCNTIIWQGHEVIYPTYTVEEQGPLCRSKPLQEGPLTGHWSMAVAPPGSLEHHLVYWPWVVGPRKQSRTEVVVVELVGLDFEW